MSDLKQAVARAMRLSLSEYPSDACVHPNVAQSEHMAQAALTTIFDRLMEPSEAVLLAGSFSDGTLLDQWQAMLAKAKEDAGV